MKADILKDTGATWSQNSSQGAIYLSSTYEFVTQQAYLLANNNVVQHLIFDVYGYNSGNSTKQSDHWIFANNTYQPIKTIPGFLPSGMTNTAAVDNYRSMGYRMLTIDEPGGDLAGPQNSKYTKNVNFNMFVQYNYRADKFTRHPQDGMSGTRSANAYSGSLYQLDANPFFFNDVRTSPVIYDKNMAPGKIIPAEVARKEFGLTSLAALQHCPIGLTSWHAPLAAGNSYAHPTVTTDSSAAGVTREDEDWKNGFITAGGNGITDLPDYYLNFAAIKAKTPNGKSLLLLDLSYELNHSLYDSWHVSQIGGATTAGTAWEPGQEWKPTAANSMNSRYVGTGKKHD